ncbi:MAG TPA: ATP-binding cassette domain-containing protein [Phycisphaerae bacterium]|nr:ATP-binding cassette domain-containing protein [Phycisphaerae bacterium]
MAATPALEICQVSHTVDGTRILDSVRWTIDQGDRWAMLGPNGAGKTTLLRLLCGYIWPDPGGQIRRRGEPLVDLRQLRRSIGWVTSTLVSQIPPREPVLDTVLSGRYAQVGLTPVQWEQPGCDDRSRARERLQQSGCDHLAARPFGTLSQGEQQKVLIARARMPEPWAIMLDEPCAGMDPGARERFLVWLQGLAENADGLMLVHVTHHVEEIMPAFDRTLALNRGCVVRAGSTPDVLAPSVLEELYGVRFHVVRRNGRYWPIRP